MNNRAVATSLFRAVLAERVITVLTRVITDVPMLKILADDSGMRGIATAFVVVTPIYVILCMAIVLASDAAWRNGKDLTGLETLRAMEHKTYHPSQWMKRLIKRMLQSRRLIFWVGSWFYLDPDYVTLLLRKPGESYWSILMRITVPSVCISMVVWLAVWWAAVQGFTWAVWALKWVV